MLLPVMFPIDAMLKESPLLEACTGVSSLLTFTVPVTKIGASKKESPLVFMVVLPLLRFQEEKPFGL